MTLFIQGGTIVTPRNEWPADIRCQDGKIVEVGSSLEPAPGDEVMDASGRIIFPGGVDPHVHMALPVMDTVSADDFASGSRAAVAGGTTTLIDFVHPERGQDWLEALALRKEEAARQGVSCDYAFHMAVTWWGEGTARMMERCVREEGITSFKLYMAYKQTVGLDDDDLLQAMETGAKLGVLFLVHAEHGDAVEYLRNRLAREGKLAPKYHAASRPPEVEGEAVTRAALLARLTGAQLYIVHVTCRESLGALADARRKGQVIYGETCPHYLLLDASAYEKPNFEAAKDVLSPPLRTKADQEALWRALADDDLQAVSTDHCPFTNRQKEAGREDFRLIPNGAAGVEHRLELLHTYGVRKGRLDLHRFVDLVSTRPAKLFGLYPRKGEIQPGADADLVIWNPEAVSRISASTHHHRVDNSIYEGMKIEGAPSAVITAGKIRYRDGTFLAEGGGRYLRRA